METGVILLVLVVLLLLACWHVSRSIKPSTWTISSSSISSSSSSTTTTPKRGLAEATTPLPESMRIGLIK